MKSWASVALPPIAEKFHFPRLSLFDTQSQKIRTLPTKGVYRMYVCGITPYDATHLGHAATYLTFDLINRYLRATGADVRYVQNITDIDDPLLERANRDGVDWRDLAHSQIELFRADMTDLHVIPPADYIGAVDSIDLVIEAIKELQLQGSIYEVEGDLYFSPSSDAEFGTRSHLSHEKMVEIFGERGGDPKRNGKRNPLDCLVWLQQRANEPGWPSPFGVGRPGWHIECSAIALTYLQPDSSEATSIDIQGGGSDLIFPHHDMGAAQGALLEGKPFADFYVHGGMIGLDGEKMSKSKGQFGFCFSSHRSRV
jgi:L-cysteine:1D-myo-inositol 2-amino-2-deoxy-alpha-D-glucopyranoside ligase